MTAHVQQHVIPRRRAATALAHYVTTDGHWQARASRPQSRRWLVSFNAQQGSVTHSTVATTFSLASLLCVALLGFFYLQQVFGTAAQGTDIHALENHMIELREQQRALELEGAQLRSIQAVEERVKRLNLVAVDQVAYMATTPEHVAIISAR